MNMKLISVVTTFLALNATVKGDEKNMGPVGKIVIRSINDCKVKSAGEVVLQAAAKSVDDKGTKAMFINMTNKIPIDATMKYYLAVNKWENSGWKSAYNHSGNFCQDMAKYLPKMWQKLRTVAQPAIPVACPIEPGSYSVKKFQTISKDVDIPTVFYGRLSVKVFVLQNGKEIFCMAGEADSQAPKK